MTLRDLMKLVLALGPLETNIRGPTCGHCLQLASNSMASCGGCHACYHPACVGLEASPEDSCWRCPRCSGVRAGKEDGRLATLGRGMPRV